MSTEKRRGRKAELERKQERVQNYPTWMYRKKINNTSKHTKTYTSKM
jgi:hypothetical protein